MFAMKNKAQRCIKFFCQSGMLSIAFMFAPNASAFVLGEIQVLSHLGQPLTAKIALVDLSEAEALQFEAHLAGIEAYKKTDLPYPEGHKFRFQLVNEQGTPPYIRAYTLHPIDDPFVNLLIETSSTSGRFIKAYTFLLDPPPSWPLASVTAEQPLIIQSTPQTASRQASTETATDKASDSPPVADKPVKAAVKRKKPKRMTTAQTQATPDVMTEVAAPIQDSQPHMKLAMSLSISSHDPSAPPGADALQEELIAKEKTLEDLNLQINAMQASIKSLHDKLKLTNQLSSDAISGVPASSEAASAIPEIKQESRIAVPTAQPLPQPGKLFETDWLKPALAFVALLLAIAGFVWYRKYKQSQDWQQGPFDDLSEEPAVPESPFMAQFQTKKVTSPVKTQSLTEKNDVPVMAPPPAERVESPVIAPLPVEEQPTATVPLPDEKKAWPFGEQSIEIPAYSGQTSTPIVPPEYAMLMEAKRHLRSGNDKLAEDVLTQAIKANPNNTYGYLVLLSIHEKRGDTDSFARLAQQLKNIGDDSAFREASEMGRKLDPGNPLYV